MVYARVFLDTMMLVYAADERLKWVRHVRHIKWGNVEQDVAVHQPTLVRPGDAFDPALKTEVRLLPLIAFMARRRRLELLSQAEAMLELWGAPSSGDARGHFYGAPITHVPGPTRYGRVVLSGVPETLPPIATTKPMSQLRHRQITFMAGLKHPRLLQLRRACGADTTRGIDPSQLADAFHLWSAEVAGATHFLTGEKKLLALAGDSVLALACQPVSPLQLINTVCPSRIRQLYLRAMLKLDEWLHPERWHVAA